MKDKYNKQDSKGYLFSMKKELCPKCGIFVLYLDYHTKIKHAVI
jgi:hypothetical protein